MVVKRCFVPACPHRSDNSEKIFLVVPQNEERRRKWLAQINIKSFTKSSLHCCEDHFDLENDVKNWIFFKTMGQKILLKKQVVPHRNLTSPTISSNSQLSPSMKKRKLLNISQFDENRPVCSREKSTNESLSEKSTATKISLEPSNCNEADTKLAMPTTCIVVGCGNRYNRDLVSFYAVPAESNHKYLHHLNDLSRERRSKWIAAIKRGDLTESKLKYQKVCSKHFISGKPAALEDRNNPDWIPSVCMGHESHLVAMSANAVARFERMKKRKLSAGVTVATPMLEEENSKKIPPLICIIQPVPSLDITQLVPLPAKKKLRPILPKSSTGNTITDTDIETILLPSSIGSSTAAQCSQNNMEQTCSSSNTHTTIINTNTKENDATLETDVQHFEEIYIKEEPLEENTSNYKYTYDDLKDEIKEEINGVKCEKDNKNEIDSKEENAIIRINERNMENISDKDENTSYNCPFCNKLFTVKRSLKRHLNNDTTVTQFVCPMCNITFTQKCSLKKHMEEYHSKGKINKKDEKISSEVNFSNEEIYIKQEVIERDSNVSSDDL